MKNSDIELYYDKCIEFMERINNPVLKEVCQNIYKDLKEKLINKPATTGSHHFFKGGLLYHIYCVTRNAVAICNLYSNLEIDLDLVIFGGLLHDIGKTNDFFDFVENGDNTKHKGNSAAFLGHSYEGTHIVENYLNKYNIDEQFKNQVLKQSDKGELYKINNAPREYYKSLNPFYNLER